MDELGHFVNSEAVMGIGFRSFIPLQIPSEGIVYRVVAQWNIAAGESGKCIVRVGIEELNIEKRLSGEPWVSHNMEYAAGKLIEKGNREP